MQDIIAAYMNEHGVSQKEAFEALYMCSFTPFEDVNSALEYFKTIQATRDLTEEEQYHKNILTGLKSVEDGHVITVPPGLTTAEEFFDWLHKQ